MIIFATDRLNIRRFTENDKDHFFSLQGNPEVMQYIRRPRTKEESDNFLSEKILDSSSPYYDGYWAVEEKHSGIFVGSCVIIPIPDDEAKMQLGYSFLPAYWGKGYASEVALGGMNYFYTQTDLPEIYGVTETPNIASQKVLIKAGFQLFGSKMDGEKELLVFRVVRKQKSSI